MEKVRFSCPRCSTVMQTAADRVDSEVACPQCGYQFRLVENEKPAAGSTVAADAPTLPPSNQGTPATTYSQNQDSTYSKPFSQPSPMQNYGQPGVSQFQTPAFHQQDGRTSYSCPYCGTTHPPTWKSEVSQLGWIVFVILLMTTCFLCFIGLFIRDRFRVCSNANCRARLD